MKKKTKVFKGGFTFLNYYWPEKSNKALFNLTLPRPEEYHFMKMILN